MIAASPLLRNGRAAVATGLALVLFAVATRPHIEQTMARHMLLQIPLLLAGGMFLGRWLFYGGSPETRSRLAAWNENSLSGLLVFLFVTAYWMVPKALEDAIASAAVEQAKIFSLIFAGVLLPVSLARANIVIQLFFLGNFASMMAFAGLLYQDTPVRLCNAYLLDDQQNAGAGLVAIAVAAPLLWYLLRKQNLAERTEPQKVATKKLTERKES